MTNEQLISIFNPAGGPTLSPENVELMHSLTDEQINILAEAYPNQPTRRSYLRLYDKNLEPDKQLYQLSTWQNLRNVRKFSGKKNLIAWDFYHTGSKFVANKATGLPGKGTAKRVVVDMTAQQAADELRASLVDNSTEQTTTTTTTKVTKPAPTKRSAKNKTTQTEAPANVDNVETPPDQQFTSGQ